jgi:DNA-binding Lrp family transcriptional regulator
MLSRVKLALSIMSHVDSLQTRIMKELTSYDRFHSHPIMGSSSKLARRLGLNDDTVRMRLNRPRKSGILEGWQLMINPRLIKRESASVVFDCDDVGRKQEILNQIKLIEGVVLILDFYETGFRVLFYYQNKPELERKVELIASICRGRKFIFWENKDPPCMLRLKRTDWEILSELRNKPKSTMTEVAAKLGISVRTAKRRLALMTENNAFFIVPKTNMRKFPGF